MTTAMKLALFFALTLALSACEKKETPPPPPAQQEAAVPEKAPAPEPAAPSPAEAMPPAEPKAEAAPAAPAPAPGESKPAPAAEPAQTAAPPETVVLEASYGTVTFPHATHASAFECTSCHGEGTPAKFELGKDKAHTLCKGCHQSMGAGPTQCTGCHKKG